MPIIVPAGVVNPPIPTEAVSPDNILRIWADPDHGGVRMYADFGVVSIMAHSVSFIHDDGTLVRGGDRAAAVDGEALGFDHEPSLESITTYRAIAYDAAGIEMWRSGPASVMVPEPTGLFDLWVKSLADAKLSMLVSARIPAPEIGTTARLQFTTPQGAIYPAGTFDRRSRSAIEILIRLPTQADRQRWDDLLDSGHLLLQWRTSYGERDFYAVADESRRSVFISMTDQRRDVRTAFVPIARPTTIETTAQVPGYSHAEAMIIAPTYNDAMALWGTYLDAAGFPDA